MYRFKINELMLNSIQGEIPLKPKKVNVFIGPNNSGKSRFLKELRDYLSGDMRELSIIKEMKFDYPEDFEKLDESYHLSGKMVKDLNGNWVLRAFSNKTNNAWNVHASFDSLYTKSLHSFGGDWKDHFKNIIGNREESGFFEYLGPLFFQYLGTEERLTICKEQLDHGLDSNNTNYLSSFKFETMLLKELCQNVKRIFHKNIILDTQTLGDRIVFRVGDDFEYINGLFGNEQGDISRLFNEKKLDDQGDGLKSYVSTFLSLNLKGSDVLLIDEPEAFLHPPLARQVGELIGDFGDEKQIFVSTHSVEVLKGILSKSSDVNVIRITQPETYKNQINILDKGILKNIIQTPLLRVSRILEGLFCKKVVITEAEADELIYQELIEKIFPQSGLYFAHGQNKQTLADIAELYHEIGIEYEIIVDFDVLRDSTEFYKFLKIMPLKEKERQRYKVYAEKMREIVNDSVEKEGLSEEELNEIQKKKRDEVYHKQGLSFFDVDLQGKISNTLEVLSCNHLHILESGELETLLISYGIPHKNKKEWITEAINKVGELGREDIVSNNKLYKFLESIKGID